MARCDIAVLGAGPYGLSAAAHLKSIKGLDVRTFGKPMSFWQENMPAGMLLRSSWTASHLSDPNRSLTLEAYEAANGSRLSRPVPLERFVQYGQWFQNQSTPELDRRKILRIESDPNGFRLHLEDGDALVAKRVVVAAGIGSFAWRPEQFVNLPSALVSHTSEHTDLRNFAGKHVMVIGSGQSALESAALLHENGCKVEVSVRARRIHWLQGLVSRTLNGGLGSAVSKMLYAPTDVGPAGLCQIIARPEMFRRLPRHLQTRLWRRTVRPAGARWLVERLRNVPLNLDRTIASATSVGGKVKVRFQDGSEQTVDHVMLGTGYRVDVSKYDFLAPELIQAVRRAGGYPVLSIGFESSVSGLHFLGAPAVWSFGPLMQFVAGTAQASRLLVRGLKGEAPAQSLPAGRLYRVSASS